MKASEYAEKLSEAEREQKRIKRKKSTFEVPANYANRNEFADKIKEKIFDMEQIVRYASNLYRKE